MKLQDATDSTKLATVNDGKLSVSDSDLLTVGVAGLTLDAARNSTLVGIETAIENSSSSGIANDDENSITLEITQQNILQELKKMNLILSLAFDIEVSNSEV